MKNPSRPTSKPKPPPTTKGRSILRPFTVVESVICCILYRIWHSGKKVLATIFADFPLVMGFLLINVVLIVTANVVADMLYAAADPRIRLT